MSRRDKTFLINYGDKKSLIYLIGHALLDNSLLGRIKEGKNSQGSPPLEYISQVVRGIGCETYYEKRKVLKSEE